LEIVARQPPGDVFSDEGRSLGPPSFGELAIKAQEPAKCLHRPIRAKRGFERRCERMPPMLRDEVAHPLELALKPDRLDLQEAIGVRDESLSEADNMCRL
jgi:hypothetical protein